MCQIHYYFQNNSLLVSNVKLKYIHFVSHIHINSSKIGKLKRLMYNRKLAKSQKYG